MENYVVRFQENEREAVLDILSRSNDIIINTVEPTSAHITIQLDESEAAYEALLQQIDHELNSTTVIIIKST